MEQFKQYYNSESDNYEVPREIFISFVEEKEDTEFTQLFLNDKLKELEAKRVYYRKWREERAEEIFKTITEPLNDDLSKKMKEELWETTDIHKKFEWIHQQIKDYTALKHYIGSEWVYQYYSDNCAPVEADSSIDILNKVGDYLKTDFPVECRDDLMEEIHDDPPQDLIDSVIQNAIDENDVVDYSTWDEKDDEYRDVVDKINKINEAGNEIVLSLIRGENHAIGFSDKEILSKDLEDLDDVVDKWEDIASIVRDSIIEKINVVAKYDALKKSVDADDLISMLENITTNTERICNEDVKRVDEIKRLRQKCNDIIKYYNMKADEILHHRKGSVNYNYDTIQSIRFNIPALCNFVVDTDPMNEAALWNYREGFNITETNCNLLGISLTNIINKHIRDKNSTLYYDMFNLVKENAKYFMRSPIIEEFVMMKQLSTNKMREVIYEDLEKYKKTFKEEDVDEDINNY